VNVDAEKATLCTRKETFSREENAFIFNNSKLFIERSKAIEELNKRPGDPVSGNVILSALTDPFWYIRSEALSYCKELVSTKKELLKEMVIHMAKTDPKSSVRADAVEFLTKHYGDASCLEIFKVAMNDQSYSVIGEGLKGITKVDPKEGMKLAKNLESEKNSRILLSIANLYAENGDDSNNDFFMNIAPQFKGFNNIGYLNTYVSFLKRCQDETVTKSIPVFENVARNGSSKWVKYFGQKGINDLARHYKDKAEKLQMKIKDVKETNPNATGLTKMESDLKAASEMAEKLSVIYNSLIQ